MPLVQNFVLPRVVKAVCIPATAVNFLAADAAVEVDINKSDAGLDEPPGEQAALTVGGSAVRVAHLLRFLREIKGVADLRRVEHADRLFVIRIEPAGLGRSLQQP